MRAQVGVLNLSELGSIRRVAALVLLLSEASVWSLRDGVGHMGPREPAGGLEGELQRLSNDVIRERARSARLTALQACSDTEFSNGGKKSAAFAVFPLLLDCLPWGEKNTTKNYCLFCNSPKTTKQYLLFF